jgi:hypothetical protein
MKMKNIEKMNFRKVESCNNCKHHFRNADYDWHGSLHCQFGAEKRPNCGSPMLNEGFKHDEEYDLWDDWSMTNSILENSVCDNWEEKIPGISKDEMLSEIRNWISENGENVVDEMDRMLSERPWDFV